MSAATEYSYAVTIGITKEEKLGLPSGLKKYPFYLIINDGFNLLFKIPKYSACSRKSSWFNRKVLWPDD